MTRARRLGVAVCVAAILWAGGAKHPCDAAALRFDIVDKVGWGGEQAANVPKAVEETYVYDAKLDTVAVTVKFDSKGFAPVPPMLALAMQYGFRATLDPKPLPMKGASCFGPLVGYENSDGYTWSVQGLGRYVLERPALDAGKAPKALQDELEAEVAKVLEAGHLAPWLFLVNVPGSGADERGDVYWDDPAEVLYLLAEVAPLLPAGQAKALRDYLKAERENWPPETRGSTPLATGTRRECFAPGKELLKRWEEKNLGWRLKRPPGLWSLYGLARFYEFAGEKPTRQVMDASCALVARSMEFRDWATLYWLRGRTPEFNAVHGANRAFAGLVGFVRLARMAGDKDAEAMGWGLLARVAALRCAMGKYTQYMDAQHLFNVNYDFRGGRQFAKRKPEDMVIKVETDPERYTLPKDPAWWVKRRSQDWIGDLVTWNWSRPIDNVRQVHRLDETGVDVWEWCGTDCYDTGQKRELPADENKDYWYMRLAPYLLPFRDMVPEEGRFLADYLKPETEAFCARVVENQPHAYAAYAEAILSAEVGFNLPSDAYGQFNARAWVLGEKPGELERCVDVPWLRVGDLYYMHKLAEAIEAYRGVTWQAPGR